MSSNPGFEPGLGEANDPDAELKRTNVLVLDGGGVRGLSSLLILQALMVQVNSAVEALDKSCGKLHPYHVFQLVAGTSTGGLIALMLGIMGLTVDDCIAEYENVARVIFGKKHLRGRMSFGLANARYSGKRLRKCVQKLLRERGLDENESIAYDGAKTACAVICREHSRPSQYSKLIHRAVPICSLPCQNRLICKVCDAARATSAAPTYFKVMDIDGRYFTDGGFEHNNPSFSIFYHYTSGIRKKSTKPSQSLPEYSVHPGLDCSRTRFVNIGTGARQDDISSKRKMLADLVPRVIRTGVFLMTTLKESAVNSQQTADMMEIFAERNPEIFEYERFDADHGVSDIRLDRYDALGEIREKTRLYLAKQDTKDRLEEVGKEIAEDFIRTRASHQHNDDSRLSVPDHTRLGDSLSTPRSSSALTDQSSSGIEYIGNEEPHVLESKCDNVTKNGVGTVHCVT